jgi:uncharacterized membrane protein YfcA
MTLIDLLLVPLGAAIGMLVAVFGAGGSLVTLPVLVGFLGLTPFAATTASLIITGTTAATGLITPARAGRVAWRVGAILAILGIPAAWLGARWAAGANPAVLLTGFAVLVLVAALVMATRRSGDDVADRIAGRILRCPAWTWCRAAELARWFALATVVGLLTGIFGVGGGFIVVPALVIVVGLAPHTAIGTSLLVITANSVVGLAARWGAPIDWAVVVPLAAGGAVGALIGARWAARLPERRLQQALTMLLIVVAGWAMTRAVTA